MNANVIELLLSYCRIGLKDETDIDMCFVVVEA